SSGAGCKPNFEGIDKNPVGIIWINRDPLVVPVLGIVARAATAIDERIAIRTGKLGPACAAVSRVPNAKLATVGTSTTIISVRRDRLHLRVNVIRVARRD